MTHNQQRQIRLKAMKKRALERLAELRAAKSIKPNANPSSNENQHPTALETDQMLVEELHKASTKE